MGIIILNNLTSQSLSHNVQALIYESVYVKFVDH
jgi:hypothetical protein